MIRTLLTGFAAWVILSATRSLADDDPTQRLHGLTLKQVAARIETYPADEQIVTGLQMRTFRGVIRYDLAVSPNPDQISWLIRLNLPKAVFEKTGREYKSAGYEITVSDSVDLGRQRYFSGVWVRQPKASKPLDLPDGPLPISGEFVEQFTAVDALMTGFLKEHHVAGATLVIARDGKELYARGFGWADVDEQTPMQPNAAMRIASLSKPMTAVAIMQLVEQERLGLDDQVMPLLKAGRFRRPADKRWDQITVRQLLQHTGGWDRDESSDPMFMPNQARTALDLKRPPKPRDMVAWQLQQPLDFDPGSRESYSNFGYCVLGRIIAEVSGQDYEKYMSEHLLAPARMAATRLGKTRLEKRGADEVRYYMQNQELASAVWSVFPDRRGKVHPQEVDRPYGAWDLEVMDAHAGWVSTAPDLVRFVSAVFTEESGLVDADTRATMLARPGHVDDSNGYWYGCGWNVRAAGRSDFDAWHAGILDGTSTLLVRRWDGYTWAVLFNTDKSSSGESLALLIDRPLYGSIR